MNCSISVRRGIKKNFFRVLVNHIQEGAEVNTAAQANKHAQIIAKKYPNPTVHLWNVEQVSA